MTGRHRYLVSSPPRSLLGLLLLALVLVGCSPATDSATEPTETDSATETTATGSDDTADDDSESETQEIDSVLRIVVPAMVESADQAVYQGRTTSDLVPNWGSPLLRWTVPEADATQLLGPTDVEGALAESFERDDDGHIVLRLREAVSEYGNQLTANDVAWSFDRLRETDPIGRFLMSVGGLAPQDTVEVIDDRTVRIRVDSVSVLNLPVLVAWPMTILDSTELQKHSTEDDPWATQWLSTHSATFGPYRIDSFVPGEAVRLVRNSNYWGSPPPIDQVAIRGITDSSSRFQLISTGEADFAEHLSLGQLARLELHPDAVPLAELSSNFDGIFLNQAFEPFADARVRLAISIALDRDAIVQGPYQGFGNPATRMISSATPQPSPPPGVEYNPEAARALLDEAGYAEGIAFTLNLEATRAGMGELAVLVAAQLKAVGIDVTINVFSSTADFQAARTQGTMEAYLGVNRPLVNDPGYLLRLLHHSEGITNQHGYANDQVDALIEEILALDAGPERDDLIFQVHEILLQDTPWVPLVETVEAHARRSNVCGYLIYPDTHTKIWELEMRADAC